MLVKVAPGGQSVTCNLHHGLMVSGSGVGVTKAISSVPLISRFFTIVKTLVTYCISCSYLTGVAAAQLR